MTTGGTFHSETGKSKVSEGYSELIEMNGKWPMHFGKAPSGIDKPVYVSLSGSITTLFHEGGNPPALWIIGSFTGDIDHA